MTTTIPNVGHPHWRVACQSTASVGDFRTRQLRSIFHHLLNDIEKDAAESLPDEIIGRCNLIPRLDALRKVHFPADIPDEYNLGSPSHRRLIFEEFFWLSFALQLKRGERRKEPKGTVIEIPEARRSEWRICFRSSSPKPRRRVVKQIFDDMTSRTSR